MTLPKASAFGGGHVLTICKYFDGCLLLHNIRLQNITRICYDMNTKFCKFMLVFDLELQCVFLEGCSGSKQFSMSKKSLRDSAKMPEGMYLSRK